MVTHVTERSFGLFPREPLVLIPHPIHLHIGAFAIIRRSAQRAENPIVCRVLVWHIQFRRHYYLFALLGEMFRAAQDSAKILRGAVNSIIHHHTPSVREGCHLLCSEVNRVSVSAFRLQSRNSKNPAKIRIVLIQ